MESFRIGNLPEELEHEIMLRLPVKSLLVCKCVCKDWCALIKSPSFVNRHFNHESNQECLYFEIERHDYAKPHAFAKYQDDERHSLVEETYLLKEIPAKLHLMGLEKGIFCVMGTDKYRIGLLNPATREFKTLPPLPLQNSDPHPSPPTCIGFGLDPCSGDFKVVVFMSNRLDKYAFVYNLSSDSWKRIEAMDKDSYYRRMGIQALNGVMHWLARFVDNDIVFIVAFDLRTEKFQEIAIPDALGKTGKDLKLTAYCDSLAVMSYESDEGADLWVMGRDGLWSKSFSIGPFQERVWSLCVWKKTEMFFHTAFSRSIMCDVSIHKVRTLILPGAETYPHSYLRQPLRYKESLVSLGADKADCFQDLFLPVYQKYLLRT